MNVAELTYDDVRERVTVLPFGDRYHIELDVDGVEGGVVTMHVAGNTVSPRRNTFDEGVCAREPQLFRDLLCADALAIVKRYEDEYEGPTDAELSRQYDTPSAAEQHEASRRQQVELKR